MGGKNDQPSELTSTVTQEASIPSFLRPFLEQSAGVAGGALGDLQGLINSGNLVSGFNSDQLAGFDQARDVALGGGGFIPTAQEQALSTARGDFLFGGQGFNEAVDASVRAAQPGILSTFGGAGRGTGGLAQQAIAQSSADAFARLFSQERSRQTEAASRLPGLGLLGSNILSSIGGQQQNQAQRELSAPINAQQSLFGSALGGLPTSSLIGQSQTSTQPLFQNQGAGILGGGLAGLGLLSGIGQAGGIRGLLGGLF